MGGIGQDRPQYPAEMGQGEAMYPPGHPGHVIDTRPWPTQGSKDVPQIVLSTARYEGLLGEMDTIIEQLRAKCEAVLRPDIPSPMAPPAHATEIIRANAPLAELISAKNNHLESNLNQLRNLLARIEL